MSFRRDLIFAVALVLVSGFVLFLLFLSHSPTHKINFLFFSLHLLLSFAAAFALCRLAADFASAFQLLLNIETCRFSRKVVVVVHFDPEGNMKPISSIDSGGENSVTRMRRRPIRKLFISQSLYFLPFLFIDTFTFSFSF